MSDTVERYFRAMQAGVEAEDELVRLFAVDGVFVDAFGGGRHVGHEAIRRYIATSRASAPPEMRLTVERVDVDGDVVEASWACESPIFVAPARGRDRFTIRNGEISLLESTLTDAPKLR